MTEWEALPVEEQELVMGRTKADSEEIEEQAGVFACRADRSG